jgi:phosphogluconate dehydratase
LLSAGLLHEDVRTVWGKGLTAYTVEAKLGENGTVKRVPVAKESGDTKVVPRRQAVPAQWRRENAAPETSARR